MNSRTNGTLAYTAFGIVFGFAFPVVGIAVDEFLLRPHPTPLPELFATNLLHYIISLAPIVLGLVFYLLGRAQINQLALADEKHASDHNFKLLVEGVTDYAIYMLDRDGYVMNWNSGAERAEGYSTAEVLGQHYALFYSEEDRRAGLPESDLEMARSSGKFEAEGWRFRKDGTQFWAHVGIDAIIQNGEHVGFAVITRDRTEQNETAMRIAHLARHDSLTGLPNRTQFIDRLDTQLDLARQSGGKVAVVNIDLDRFKDINDTHGHAVGDILLSVLSSRLAETVGEGEMVARFGGDEFVAFKTYSNDDALREMLARLQTALTDKVAVDQNEILPGASLGVAVYPVDALERDKLLNNADLAMYRAKDNVERKVCYYEAAMDEAARQRRLITTDLWTALDQGQFFLHYQEQRSVGSETVTGYEALLRWQHPERGLISPVDFIPIAEECGAIIPIGDWVLKTACTDAVNWEMEGKVAVNVSSVQLGSVSFVDTVRNVLMETGLPPSHLELEVTETSIIGDKQRALHILRQLKAMGVAIALDDFGTGYSSLETLRLFPFDRIKIDRGFINELATSRQSKAFLRAILALGNSLDVNVLAEGVEDQKQLDILAEEGCNDVQGFLFGYPQRIELMRDAEKQKTGSRRVAAISG